MLSTVEIIPSARRTTRRGIEIGCELFSQRGGSRRERVLDLSPDGARISTEVPLFRGEEVLLSFVAPGAMDDRISTMCRVVHAGGGSSIVGVSFLELPKHAQHEMRRRLRGVPPPLPSQRMKSELVWVDALVTWEEDLGDRVNTFAVAERFEALEDRELEIAALAPVLTGSRSYLWKACA